MGPKFEKIVGPGPVLDFYSFLVLARSGTNRFWSVVPCPGVLEDLDYLILVSATIWSTFDVMTIINGSEVMMRSRLAISRIDETS